MDALIDKIYEAATVADGWPRLFEQLGAHFKTRGGLIFTSSLSGTTWTGGGEALEIMQDFVGGGWMLQNDRVPRMVTNRHPGFITDLDLYSWDQVHTLPMYTEFLIPRGVFASAATVVSGLGGDDLILSLEGFESHDAVAVAIPTLDQLRPHLARAGVMAARLGLEQANAAVRALEMIGTPAAVVGSMGQVRAVNDLFSKELGVEVLDFRDRLQLADRSGSAQLADALGRIRAGQAAGRSIAIRGTVERGPRILHVLPIRGAGYDIFPNSSAILILSGEAPRSDLSEGLLGALFDLTPAEARVARALARGKSVAGVAADAQVSELTVRTQMKGVFSKVGVTRQADLVSLLRDLALPLLRA